MSDGYCTARSLSRSECLNEWITHPSGSLGFGQLLVAAEAKLALVPSAEVYLRKAKYAHPDPIKVREKMLK